jgi:hypothetical protein
MAQDYPLAMGDGVIPFLDTQKSTEESILPRQGEHLFMLLALA